MQHTSRVPAALASGLSLVLLASAPRAGAQEITEPKSGVTFAATSEGMSLLGVGLRTQTLLKVKVYAVGLYVADSALAGPLAAHKGNTTTPAFYKDLVSGDFEKQIVMKYTRDLTADQVQEAFGEALAAAEPTKVSQLLALFGPIKEGQECVLTWKPGGLLEARPPGLVGAPIADKAFAAAVLGIWLGDKPIQADIKKGLVSRAPELIK
jgi:hypothetical protein